MCRGLGRDYSLFGATAATYHNSIFAHPKFPGDGRPGTFGAGTPSNKIDYILMSPALAAHVTGGGVWRKGVWAGTKGTIFPHYPEMTKPEHEASDHAAVYADFDL
jgi:hypothetical protein